MTKIFTLAALLIVCCSFSLRAQHLFRISQANKVGYINELGSIVIPPVYYNGGDFSEGVAAVRENGLYGYIDTTRKYILPAAFDVAYCFDHGIAKVYKNGSCLFIDKNGKTVIPPSFTSLSFVTSTKALVKTATGKTGLLDMQSMKLVLDTVYSSIENFTGKVAIAKKYLSRKKNTKDPPVGVVDTSGNVIVRFGKYNDIKPFSDGLAVVEFDNADVIGAIDTNGVEIFKKKFRSQYSFDDAFHGGFLKAYLYKYWLPEKEGVLSTSDKSYPGFINTSGDIVLDDTTLMAVYDFSCGRAFIKLDHFKFKMVDTKFNMVGNEYYEGVINNRFKNGYAIVETKSGDGITDTSGNFIVKPGQSNISEAGIIGNYFFTGSAGKTGVSDMNGNVVIQPSMQEFDRAGFINGLLKAVVDSSLCYINTSGKIVWQEKKGESTTLSKLNIDYMNRGYFYAYSSMVNNKLKESGGWYRSPNLPVKITNADQFESNAVAIKIDTNTIDTFAHSYAGFKVFVSNTTKDTALFNAQDSRLHMKLQALNYYTGKWSDIEYLPSSWCGNSYHTIELEPAAYWSFTIPQYDGAIVTKLRAALTYVEGTEPKKEKIIYSNIINGRINPAQFWNKRSYYPQGLMDPYYD